MSIKEEVQKIEISIESEFDKIKAKFHVSDWHSAISSYIAALEARVKALEEAIKAKV